jgi:hypothetical protein
MGYFLGAAIATTIQVVFVARMEGTYTQLPVRWHLLDQNTGEVQEANNTARTTFMVEDTHQYLMTVSRPQFRTITFKVKKPFVFPYYDVQMRRESAPVNVIHSLRKFIGF